MSYVLSPRVALNPHFVSVPSVPINRQPSQATLIPRHHECAYPSRLGVTNVGAPLGALMIPDIVTFGRLGSA